MGKPRLTSEQRIFIITALACFDAPGIVSAAVKKEFGITFSPQACENYDPYKRAGRNMAKKWKEIFDETRQTFLADAESVGITHRIVRIRSLARMAVKAEDMGNMSLASSLLEQVAKEMGGAYTNRREIKGAGFVPRQAASLITDKSTLEEAAASYRATLNCPY